eukprot:3177296-Rhodomonas_salina.1
MAWCSMCRRGLERIRGCTLTSGLGDDGSASMRRGSACSTLSATAALPGSAPRWEERRACGTSTSLPVGLHPLSPWLFSCVVLTRAWYAARRAGDRGEERSAEPDRSGQGCAGRQGRSRRLQVRPSQCAPPPYLLLTSDLLLTPYSLLLTYSSLLTSALSLPVLLCLCSAFFARFSTLSLRQTSAFTPQRHSLAHEREGVRARRRKVVFDADGVRRVCSLVKADALPSLRQMAKLPAGGRFGRGGRRATKKPGASPVLR